MLEKYPSKDLTYKIIGVLYEAYNNLGFGYQEKYYQRAIGEELKKEGLRYKKELINKVEYNKKIIGRYFVDFLIEDRVILETKVANDFYQKDINQILAYMKHFDIKLGILSIFTKNGVKVKRLIN